MRDGVLFGTRNFLIFLSSFLLLSFSGHPREPDAKDLRFPLGEMISRGEVKFEVRQGAWKNVDFSYFPIFDKRKIKTERGTSIITLKNDCNFELGQNTVVSFEQTDRMELLQGRVVFRIPASEEMTIRAGSLAITKSRLQQASKGTVTIPARGEETLGSVVLNPNGSVTIRNLKGSLSILDQEGVVLASLASKESITIPATIASGRTNIMVAQAGEAKARNEKRRRAPPIVLDQEWTYLGLNAVEWIGVKYAAALMAGLTYVLWPEGDRDRRIEQVPVCP